MHSPNFTVSVETIKQTDAGLIMLVSRVGDQVTRRLLDLEEQAVKEALIARGWIPPENSGIIAATPHPPVAAQEPVAWLVCSVNSDGTLALEHAAVWREAAHEHINDAITEHGIEDAANWVVLPAYTHPATQQAAPAEWDALDAERRMAIKEGHRNAASDNWFKARYEGLDTNDRRNVFSAGFDRGWDAALAAQKGN